MKSVICTVTLVFGAIAPAVHADATRGSQAASGSERLMLERWADRSTRNQMSSLEAGFANMLLRSRDDVPAASVVRGDPDPVAVRIAAALRAQRASGGTSTGR